MSVTLPRGHRPLPACWRVTLCAVLLAAGTNPAAAQKRPAPPLSHPAQAVATTEAPAAPDLQPPYEPQLLRLAEIMGTLAYLRDLCGDHDSNEWRAKMANLIASEQAASDGERERLAGAYNEGFRGYALTYRTCTANAKLVIARSLKEGEHIARDVKNLYGGS